MSIMRVKASLAASDKQFACINTIQRHHAAMFPSNLTAVLAFPVGMALT